MGLLRIRFVYWQIINLLFDIKQQKNMEFIKFDIFFQLVYNKSYMLKKHSGDMSRTF